MLTLQKKGKKRRLKQYNEEESIPSIREVFFGKPSQEKTKGEYQPKKKLLKKALIKGMSARVFCLSCGKHFQVDEERSQEILGKKADLKRNNT